MRFFGSLAMLVRETVRTAPLRAAGFFALAVLVGLLGPVVMLGTGLAVSRAPAAFRAGIGSIQAYALMQALGLVGLAFVAAQVVAPLRNALALGIGSRLGQRLRERLFAATLEPEGIAHLEDPAIAEEIGLAGEFEWQDIAPLTRIVQELGDAATKVVTAIGAMVLLAQFAWWAPLVVIAGTIGTHLTMAEDSYEETKKREEFALLNRRGDYLQDLALDPAAAKEVRLFGLVGFVADELERLRVLFYREVWRARRGRLGWVLLTIGVLIVSDGIVLAALAIQAYRGNVGAGLLTVSFQAVMSMGVLSYPAFEAWWVDEGARALPHLARLPGRTAVARLGGTRSAESLPRKEIRFSGVRFAYAHGNQRAVLDGLDLVVPVGSSLAIVGENGAGKTTLLKLLTRMYDPSEGAILVDGIDLRELDPASWRRRVAVIFQDFVRYEYSARDNIAFGAWPSGGAGDEVGGGLDERVERAARRAGALDLVRGLPNGADTVLARQYRGGIDLSGGEWQRIALARALFAADAGSDGRGARLLVLDEPTAALDVRAEVALFERFLELTAGTTTILVTHRLSSVRHADRIAVLEGGRVIELGTHDELLAADGAYARMFRLQAERFVGSTEEAS